MNTLSSVYSSRQAVVASPAKRGEAIPGRGLLRPSLRSGLRSLRSGLLAKTTFCCNQKRLIRRYNSVFISKFSRVHFVRLTQNFSPSKP